MPKPTAEGPRRTQVFLPRGWTAFQSDAGKDEPGWWYATAPYDISRLTAGIDYQHPAWGLNRTVSAPTQEELKRLVDAQVRLYRELTA